MFVSLCCSPLVQGVVTECVCGGDRGVFTLLRRAGVFHTALTPGTELWLKPRHTHTRSLCVCVFEENRDSRV